MRFELRESPCKFATYWVSQAEANDKAFMDGLKSEFKQWKNKGYLPVVYQSGEDSLEDGMYMLMKHNAQLALDKAAAQ